MVLRDGGRDDGAVGHCGRPDVKGVEDAAFSIKLPVI